MFETFADNVNVTSKGIYIMLVEGISSRINVEGKCPIKTPIWTELSNTNKIEYNGGIGIEGMAWVKMRNNF